MTRELKPPLSLSISTIIILAVTLPVITGILGYYLLMPGWLLVERVVIDPNNRPGFGDAVGITESELLRYTALKKAIEQADRAYPLGHTPAVMASNFEATKMIDRFQMHEPGYSNHLVFSNDNNDSNGPRIYFIRIVFGYEEPVIQ